MLEAADMVKQPPSDPPARPAVTAGVPTAPSPSGAAIARRRRRRLNRAVVARAVIDVGFDRATLTAVADELGVNHATLYGHVASRDDMLLAGVEALLDDVDFPEFEGSWQTTVVAESHLMFRLFLDHPGLSVALGLAPEPPRRMTERFAGLAEHLLDAGFEPAVALSVAELVYHQSSAWAERELGVADVDTAQVEQWESDWSSALDPRLAAEMPAHFTRSADDRFGEVVEVLVAGIEQRSKQPD